MLLIFATNDWFNDKEIWYDENNICRIQSQAQQYLSLIHIYSLYQLLWRTSLVLNSKGNLAVCINIEKLRPWILENGANLDVYKRQEFIVGTAHNTIIDSDDRVVILWGWYIICLLYTSCNKIITI